MMADWSLVFVGCPSRLLIKSASGVLASLRGSPYGREYGEPLSSLRPCWTAFLNSLRAMPFPPASCTALRAVTLPVTLRCVRIGGGAIVLSLLLSACAAPPHRSPPVPKPTRSPQDTPGQDAQSRLLQEAHRAVTAGDQQGVVQGLLSGTLATIAYNRIVVLLGAGRAVLFPAMVPGLAWSASRSKSRDLDISQFWQNLQARLQPAVPNENTLVPG